MEVLWYLAPYLYLHFPLLVSYVKHLHPPPLHFGEGSDFYSKQSLGRSGYGVCVCVCVCVCVRMHARARPARVCSNLLRRVLDRWPARGPGEGNRAGAGARAPPPASRSACLLSGHQASGETLARASCRSRAGSRERSRSDFCSSESSNRPQGAHDPYGGNR